MKRSAKARRQRSEKGVSSGKKVDGRGTRKRPPVSGIRETEEARTLLENQLGSLYWWTFHAFKMRGFIRAKELHESAERQLAEDRDAVARELGGSSDGSKRGE